MPSARRGAPAGLAGGVFLALALWVNQWPLWPVGLVLLGLGLWRRSVFAGLVLAGLASSGAQLHLQLADRLLPELRGQEVTVQGWIDRLPEVNADYTRFRFRPDPRQSPVDLPGSVLTYWYRDAPSLSPGEYWQLRLQLSPPWGRVNFQGIDRELWLFSEGYGALATVRSGLRLRATDGARLGWSNMRMTIRDRIEDAVRAPDPQAVVKALALADRSGLREQQRTILARTGTSHLLAISGLHIGLASLFVFWMARPLIAACPVAWLNRYSHAGACLFGLAGAFIYSGLAGFGTPALRALVMLVTGVLVLLLRRPVHTGQALLLAMALLLLTDPPAALTAGFWLSFCAVGVLLWQFTGASLTQGPWRKLLIAQATIILALLPLNAWWFQLGSTAGLLANLVAIPVVSFGVVPLILLALLTAPLRPAWSNGLFSLAGDLSAGLLQILESLAEIPFSSISLPQPSLCMVLLASLGSLLLLLPAGLPHRGLGVILLLALFVSPLPPAAGTLKLDVLDVGQGSAVLLSSHRHLLLYDSGPGDGEDFDLVGQVIAPAIRQSGHMAPHRVLISHGDLDHAGGLKHLLQRYPAAEYLANLPQPLAGVSGCNDALQWRWDDIDFTVLHPSAHLPYLGNDSSCVLLASQGDHAVLLPGDISGAIEQRLRTTGVPTAEVLLVPHHGSKTSSSPGFLQAVRPRIAVATAGPGNRWGFPLPEIRSRYRNAGTYFWSTDVCGAISLSLGPDGVVRAESARRARNAPWRWPAADSCP